MTRYPEIHTYKQILSIFKTTPIVSTAQVATALKTSKPNALSKLKYLTRKNFISAQNLHGSVWIFWKPPLFLSSSDSDINTIISALSTHSEASNDLLSRLTIRSAPPSPTPLSNSIQKAAPQINATLRSRNFATVFTVSSSISETTNTTKRKLQVLAASNYINGEKVSNTSWIFNRLPLFLSSLPDAQTLHTALSSHSPESRVLLRRLQPILPQQEAYI